MIGAQLRNSRQFDTITNEIPRPHLHTVFPNNLSFDYISIQPVTF